jgi:uncharacterized protein (TIGR02246 family)
MPVTITPNEERDMPENDREIQGLLDREEIRALLSNYFSALDDRKITAEAVAGLYTEDGVFHGPGGTRSGRQAIFEADTYVYEMFEATHHITSDYLINVADDRATVRATMYAIDIWHKSVRDELSLDSHFVAGSVFTGDAVRTAEGWRFAQLTQRVVWREGYMPLHLITDSR